MPNIKEAIRAFWLLDPDVARIVGTSIYPEVASDVPGDLPRVTYKQIGKEDDTTLLLSTDQPTVWIQVIAWTQGAGADGGQEEADELTAAIRDARGPNPAGSRLKEFSAAWMPARGHAVATWIKGCGLDEEMTAEAQKAVGGGKKWVRSTVSVFRVTFNEIIYG